MIWLQCHLIRPRLCCNTPVSCLHSISSDHFSNISCSLLCKVLSCSLEHYFQINFLIFFFFFCILPTDLVYSWRPWQYVWYVIWREIQGHRNSSRLWTAYRNSNEFWTSYVRMYSSDRRLLLVSWIGSPLQSWSKWKNTNMVKRV